MIEVEEDGRLAGPVRRAHSVRMAAEHESGEPSLALFGCHDLLVGRPLFWKLDGRTGVRHPDIEIELIEARLDHEWPLWFTAVDDHLDGLCEVEAGAVDDIPTRSPRGALSLHEIRDLLRVEIGWIDDERLRASHTEPKDCVQHQRRHRPQDEEASGERLDERRQGRERG